MCEHIVNLLARVDRYVKPGEQVVVLDIHIHHPPGVYAIWDMSKCMSMYIMYMLSICDVMYVCVCVLYMHAFLSLSLYIYIYNIYIYIYKYIYLPPLSLMIAIYFHINSRNPQTVWRVK